ncbi:hypothetical protein I6M56_17080 [Shewanella algae]|uniref:hypothetical protein n=1 Tax=Shewanella algae TaxID=38313 RepID=UPI001AAE4D11|nr:hypothetical protein [Shewanella algae]MBO2680546.1 hypothetical protein [Shewanella algae]
MKKIFLLLMGILPFSSMATQNYLCSSCTNDASARQFAVKNFTPRLNCYPEDRTQPMTPDNMICGSTSNKIALVNPNTGVVYSFSVGHGFDGISYEATTWPFAITSEKKSLLSDAGLAYGALKKSVVEQNKIRRDEIGIISAGINQVGLYDSNQDGSSGVSSGCPTDTALAAIVDPNKLTDIENKLKSDIVNGTPLLKNVHAVLSKNGSSVDINDVQVNLSNRLGTVGLKYTSKDPSLSLQFGFRQSEGGGFMTDYLLFDLRIMKNDNIAATPIIDLTLNDLSVVAGGYTLAQLKGKNGPLAFTDPCILSKLKTLRESGDFRNSSGGPSNFSNIGENTGGPSGGGYQTCTVYFYQGGALKYVFRVPVNEC